MSTIVDQLIVTLGLDGSKFKSGAKDIESSRKRLDDQAKRSDSESSKREKKLAEDRTRYAKQTEEGAKRMALGINKVRNEALALFAVFTAGVGLKEFFSNTINNAAALGQQATNLSMSTEALSAWQRANERAGGTAAGMTAQLKESADVIAKYKLGQGIDGGLQKFFQYGGSDTSLKDGNSYLLARAKIIGDLFKQDPTKAHLLSGQMGISEEQFNLIKQGPDAILALVAAQEKNSAVTAKDAAEALKLRNQMLDLRDRLESVATKIVLQLAPSLEKLALRFQAMANWIADHKADIAEWVDSAVANVTKFVRALDSAATSVGGWKNVLIGLAALKVAGVVAPLLSLAAALVGVGSALGGIAAIGATALGVLAVVGGYKLADKLFGSERTHLQDKHRAILNGGTGDALGGMKTKDQLRAEAARQMSGIGGTGSPAMPRGMRNNNPGNIEYGKFALANGAIGSDGRFAKFPTMEAGQAAMQKLLGGYLSSGSNTVSKAISKWAPSSENNTSAYVDAVAKKLGVGPDQPLNGSHIPALADAISRHENGAAWGARNAMSAVNMPTGAGASARNQTQPGNVSTSSSDVKIGTINVQTQATDAGGIARSISGAIQNNGLISQANGGMN